MKSYVALVTLLACALLAGCKTGPDLVDDSASGVSVGLTGSSVENGDTGVEFSGPLTVTFSVPVVEESLRSSSAFIAEVQNTLDPCDGTKVPSTLSLSNTGTVLTFLPTLACGTSYAICLNDGIVLQKGGRFPGDTIQFSTASCVQITNLALSPSSPGNSTHPVFSGTAAPASSVKIYDQASCGGNVVGTGTADSSGNFSIAVTLTSDANYTLSARATLRGVASDCSAGLPYTLDTVAPPIAISSASASLVNNATSVNYTVTYTGASAITLANSDIALNTTGTATCGTKSVAGAGTTTRTVTLSNCTGDGTVGFSIGAGTAVDAAGNTAGASTPSAVFTVDNTAPNSASFSPPTSTLQNLPTATILTVNENVASSSVSAADFSIAGSCAGVSVSSVSVLNSAITANLAGTTGCSLGQTVSISLNLANITDSAGNAGIGTPSVVYTRDDVGPTSATFNPPTSTRNPLPTSVTVTYSENVISSTVSAADFSVGGTCVGVSISSVSASSDSNTATVNLSGTAGCANGQTVILTANLTGITDTLGNSGVGSSSATYTFDNAGPTVSSVNPATGLVKPVPAAAIFNFSADVDSSTISIADFSIGGTCVGPSISSVSPSGNQVTVVLANTSGCSDGQTIVITADLTGIRDSTLPTGNAGVGNSSVTYTVDLSGPTVSSFSPSTSTIDAIPSSVQVTYSADVDGATVSTADFSVGGTCVGVSVSGTSQLSNVTTVSLSGTGACNNGDTVILTANLAGVADVRGNAGSGSSSVTYTLDNVKPVVSSFSPTTSTRTTIPVSVQVTFSADVDSSSISLSDFSLSGTCTGPTITGLSQSANVTTLTLSGTGVCTDSQTLIVSVDMTGIQDLAGNSGVGTSTVTYTLDTIGPSVTSYLPVAARKNPIPSSVDVVFSSDVDSTTIGLADFSMDATSTCVGVSISGISQSSNVTTVSLAGTGTCSNNETVVLKVNLGSINDMVGNPGVGNSTVTYIFDNVGPSVSSVSPPTSTRNPVPTVVTFTWSTDLNSSTVSSPDFTLGGTCSGVSILSVNQSSNVTTVNLAGTVGCANGDTLTVTADQSGVADQAGNAGVGSTSVTYTFDNVGPLASFSPVSGSDLASSVDISFSADVDTSSITVGDFSINGASTCVGVTVSGIVQVGTTTTVSLSGTGGCASGQNVIVQVNLTGISDLTQPSGNTGSGTATATYIQP